MLQTDSRLSACVPAESKRGKVSLRVLPNDRPDIRNLFESVIPYFDAGV